MIAQLKGSLLEISGHSILTQGSVGLPLQVRMSDEWSDLAVTAVFSAGELSRDVAVTGDEITIPWELLSTADRLLKLSFHGAAANGFLVLRSNIAPLGLILPSFSPSGTEPQAPSPSRADQIQALAEQALAAVQTLREDAEAGAFSLPALPAGGTDGQVLTKRSDADRDVHWAGPLFTVPVSLSGTTAVCSKAPAEVYAAAENGNVFASYLGHRIPCTDYGIGQSGETIVVIPGQGSTVVSEGETIYSFCFRGSYVDESGTLKIAEFLFEEQAADASSMSGTGSVVSAAASGAVALDATLSRQGQAADAKAVGDALTGKLPTAQGAANAGKFIVVGSDGNLAAVALSAWQGGNY